MAMPRARLADGILAVLVLAVAGPVWWEARKLAPAPFDPLGPKTVPLWICYGLFGLGALLLGRVALGLKVGGAAQSLITGLGEAPLGYRLRPGLAVAAFLLLVAYAALLEVPGLGFRWATAAFMAALGCLMSPRRRRPQLVAAGVGILLAVLIDALFRYVFVVDLP